MNQKVPAATLRRQRLLRLAAVPVTALCAGLGLALYESLRQHQGPFDLDFGPWAMGIIGVTWGGIWALLLALPHFYWLRLLPKFYNGRIERWPLSSLLGLSVWALPQALVVLALALGFPSYRDVAGVAFLLAWGSVTLGLWLPRLFL